MLRILVKTFLASRVVVSVATAKPEAVVMDAMPNLEARKAGDAVGK